jgi:hypothetical protein
MVQDVGCRPVISEARVRAHANQCRIYGVKSDTGTGIPPSTSAFACQD